MKFKLFFFKQSGKEVLSIDAQCIIISKSVCKLKVTMIFNA